jgi:hypothetical protein
MSSRNPRVEPENVEGMTAGAKRAIERFIQVVGMLGAEPRDVRTHQRPFGWSRDRSNAAMISGIVSPSMS